MARSIDIHPLNPQSRLIRQAVDVVRNGGVIVYPTDSCYALGCAIGNKEGMERIRRIRRLDDKHHFTLVCRDLSDISLYAKVNNQAYGGEHGGGQDGHPGPGCWSIPAPPARANPSLPDC